MSKTIRRQKTGYALSLIFCLVGITALFVALWKTWPEVSLANNPISTFWALLWRDQLGLIPGVGFKLAYLIILGTIMIVSGVVVLALSRQRFYLPTEEIVLFQCSFCRKQWRGHKSKEITNCPQCHKQTYPRIVEK